MENYEMNHCCAHSKMKAAASACTASHVLGC